MCDRNAAADDGPVATAWLAVDARLSPAQIAALEAAAREVALMSAGTVEAESTEDHIVAAEGATAAAATAMGRADFDGARMGLTVAAAHLILLAAAADAAERLHELAKTVPADLWPVAPERRAATR